MKIILITASVIGLFTLMSFFTKKVDFAKDAPDGIQFKKSEWTKVLELSKSSGKPIFLDIYATWCGPCKRLKSKTFNNREVGDFYNENFINLAFDGENGEGKMLAEKYQVKGYPTLLFLNEKGEVISRSMGFVSPKEFISLGKTALNQKN